MGPTLVSDSTMRSVALRGPHAFGANVMVTAQLTVTARTTVFAHVKGAAGGAGPSAKSSASGPMIDTDCMAQENLPKVKSHTLVTVCGLLVLPMGWAPKSMLVGVTTADAGAAVAAATIMASAVAMTAALRWVIQCTS
jgi:hypothetical protein